MSKINIVWLVVVVIIVKFCIIIFIFLLVTKLFFQNDANMNESAVKLMQFLC